MKSVMAASKSERRVDKIAYVLGKLFKVRMLRLKSHCPELTEGAIPIIRMIGKVTYNNSVD